MVGETRSSPGYAKDIPSVRLASGRGAAFVGWPEGRMINWSSAMRRECPMTRQTDADYRAALDRHAGDVEHSGHTHAVECASGKHICSRFWGMLLILAVRSRCISSLQPEPASVTPSQAATMITLRCSECDFCGHDYRMPVDPLTCLPDWSARLAASVVAAQPLWRVPHS